MQPQNYSTNNTFFCPNAFLILPAMNCIVTAGPTYESLDDVRRLTNFSTGRLGTELGNFLTDQGHRVTLLIGQQATYCGGRRAHQVETFTTTANLIGQLRSHAGVKIDAVFHAAAVSDFTFGKVFERVASGDLTEITSGKFSTRHGTLLTELIPTPKIISELRSWFPTALLAGWKFEVDGDRASVLAKARDQLTENRTDACVANGRAYGAGFGIVTPTAPLRHCADTQELFAALEQMLRK